MQEELRLKNNATWSHGYQFVKWGLWFFIVGIIIGFGVLIHYLVGSRYVTSGLFLTNITLWFGSPLSLSASFLQIGGLGMAIVGALYLYISKYPSDACASDINKGTVDVSACVTHKHASLTLCNLGLILLFILGYIGYFVIDFFWPSFYYTPIAAGKNLWLILQGLCIVVYVIGIIIATNCLCKCKKTPYQATVRP